VKGKTLVIGIVIFVIFVVGAVYFAMMATINKQKEEMGISQSHSSNHDGISYPVSLEI